MCKQNLSFGAAIEAIKQGSQVARQGWNGKNMKVFLQHGIVDSRSLHDAYGERIPNKNLGQIGGVHLSLFAAGTPNVHTQMPCLCLHAADGTIVRGWLASQTDILATDWCIVSTLHGERDCAGLTAQPEKH